VVTGVGYVQDGMLDNPRRRRVRCRCSSSDRRPTRQDWTRCDVAILCGVKDPDRANGGKGETRPCTLIKHAVFTSGSKMGREEGSTGRYWKRSNAYAVAAVDQICIGLGRGAQHEIATPLSTIGLLIARQVYPTHITLLVLNPAPFRGALFRLLPRRISAHRPVKKCLIGMHPL